MVARKQHVRHSPAFEVCRPRVLGVFEQPTRSSRGKRFVDGTHLVAQGTRQKPHDGVGYDEGGEFSTGEHVVAKRKALIRKVEGALVDALVAAAHEEDALFMRKPLSRRLGKRRTARGEEDNMGLGTLARDGTHRLEDGRCLHEHALTTAIRFVINGAVPVVRPVTQVIGSKIKDAGRARPSQDGGGHVGLKEFGKHRERLYEHARSRPSSS